MFVLASSAFLIGLLHSLSPAHWFPVVLVAKEKKWHLPAALGGAITAASAHILSTTVLSLLAGLGLKLGLDQVEATEEKVELGVSIFLIVVGLSYAAYAYWSHRKCIGHEHDHHGPEVTKAKKKGPYAFLFLLGLSPCLAYLPIHLSASALGFWTPVGSLVGFALGVTLAWTGAVLAVFRGMKKFLDHPFMEHYGETITGLGITLIGVVFLVRHFCF